MPRTTVLRKLQYMVKQGYVRQDGSAYAISDAALQTTTPMLDSAIKLIIATADALRAVQNGRQNS
jgi:DNA-binding IclR family transcriptional regulator